MADALLSCHSSMAFSDWRLAMISLLLNPWSSASHAGPRPMHISLRPLHVLCSFSHGSPGSCMLKSYQACKSSSAGLTLERVGGRNLLNKQSC